MPKKPTATDAQLILQLYDLRREAEMRKARNWWLVDFWPQTADDFIKVATALGTQENNWLRQVAGYWDMAAALVLHGTIDSDLFLEGGVSGEMFFLYAKLQPILKDLREKMQSPALFSNVEKVIMSSTTGRERLKMVEARVAARRKLMSEAAKAS
ncbi:MAG: hypothetical protein AUH86_09190 [Acidobacteria bacterium 13_1_40CM_4_58_4]|nr:MAG: hypothetical protein AUH86_09190 [Acidobacteria bacterium 13_1_40CM_4_58_4]OLE57122.1 MAG: hypothetical protein AUG13_05565 [Chloroflexi bacterium 13_1_20CM_2_59_7]HLB88289.1 hypothetical protein [Terriglobales bacterium]